MTNNMLRIKVWWGDEFYIADDITWFIAKHRFTYRKPHSAAETFRPTRIEIDVSPELLENFLDYFNIINERHCLIISGYQFYNNQFNQTGLRINGKEYA